VVKAKEEEVALAEVCYVCKSHRSRPNDAAETGNSGTQNEDEEAVLIVCDECNY